MSESTDLAIIDADSSQLTVRRPPAEVLEEARKAAVALKSVIDGKQKKVVFNGEQYLEFEDWQTLGRFYGVTAKIIDTTFVTYGDVSGFSAKAVALRADGMEISSAEADCLNDEEKWRSKTKYQWIDGVKTKVGEEPVPLFQLKSMAQTRASAKALRNVLSWVAVLAGYRPTPAEELQTTTTDGTVVEGQVTESAAPVVRADGVTTIKDVKAKSGSKANADGTPGRQWTLYTIFCDDGRSGTTFDKKLSDDAHEAMKAPKLKVIPTFEQTSKGTNIVALERAPEHEPQGPEAPQVPEKILTVREVKRGDKLWWVIQGSEKEYLTDDQALADLASRIRAGDREAKVMFFFEPVPSASGKTVRKLTKIEDPPPVGEPIPSGQADTSQLTSDEIFDRIKNT